MKKRLFILLLLLTQSYALLSIVVNYFAGEEDAVLFGSGVAAAIFMVLGIAYCVGNSRIIASSPMAIKYALLYVFFALITFVCFAQQDFKQDVKTFYETSQWVVLFLVGYIIAFKSDSDRRWIVKYFLYVLYPLVAGIVIWQSFSVLESQELRVFDISFAMLVIFPFAFLSRSSVLKMVLIVATGVVTILSFKRTSVIAYSIVMLLYGFWVATNPVYSAKKRFFTVLVFVAGVAVLFGAFQRAESESGGYMVQRLMNISQDKGSNRVGLYTKLWENQETATSAELLLGNGYRSVKEKFNILAHNDLLEIMYDFGFLALAAFLFLYFQLFRYGYRFYKRRRIFGDASQAYIMGLILLFFLGMFNCLITSPAYFSMLMLFFGLSIGFYERTALRYKTETGTIKEPVL